MITEGSVGQVLLRKGRKSSVIRDGKDICMLR